jgi:hypothetical protein
MGLSWNQEIDQTLAEAKEQARFLLLHFRAAPA